MSLKKTNPQKIKSEKVRPGKTSLEPKNYNFAIISTIILYVFLVYFNTLNFGYTGDDTVLIKENASIHKGSSGLKDILAKGTFYGYNGENHGAYRPFTMLTFLAEVALWGEKPSISHFINLILYAFAGVLLFKLLSFFFNGNRIIPLIITLLFLAHPIHSEVVANIKSRDEILAFILGFLVPSYILLKNKSLPLSSLAVIFGSYFLGLLSKENAITFFIPVLLLVYFYKKESFKQIFYYSIPFLASIGVYLVLRSVLLDSTPQDQTIATNTLVHTQSFLEKSGTILLMMLEYIKKLFIPVNLSWDYSFSQIPVVSLFSLSALLSVLIHAGLLMYAVMKFRAKSLIAYFILFYFLTIAIYLNIFVLLAQNIADRFLFVPSLAFCVIIVMVVDQILKKIKMDYPSSYIIIPFSLILVFYSFRTFERNFIWKNNATFFKSGVKDAPNSFYTHQALGQFISAKADQLSSSQGSSGLYAEAAEEFQKSLKIYPEQQANWYMLGRSLQLSGNFKEAEEAYLKSLSEFEKPKIESLFNLHTVYREMGDFKKAIYYLNEANKIQDNFNGSYAIIGEIYLRMNDLNKAEQFLKKSLETEGDNKAALNNLGVIYFNLKDYEKASHYFKVSFKSDTCYFDGIKNLAVTYQLQNKLSDAIKYYEKAIACNPQDKTLYPSLINLYITTGNQVKAREYQDKLQ